MNSEEIQTVRELLGTTRSIAVIPHKNPDGDAMGACLGLQGYLAALGHDAVVISPNDYPRFLKWMPGTQGVLIYEKELQQAESRLARADLIFTLDFNHLSRTGDMQQALEASGATFIMIDHHEAPDSYAQVTYSDTTMSSTCEMVYNFIESLGDANHINEDMANCLFAGILTDTGSFKYPATSSRTLRVAADLMDRGARSTEINNKIFDTNTPDRLQLLGCALSKLVILPEYHTAYISLTQEDLDAHNYKKGDTEGFVNYGLTLEGIRFAVIFIENREEGLVKISFRSEGDFSVNEFARAHFGGGGHRNAAGGRSFQSMEQTISFFTSLLEQYKDALKS